ncbi:MAG TPA: tetratricopeptide repeat protein, partial [Rudaea sp.]|nr:tetratricopeptide repeat protein [Rudaea sp.]
ALAQVSATNKPLEQVATANLDALRAYSLGQRAYFTGNMKDALAFYQDAVRLDPQFATAHLVIARVWINANRNSDARKQIELAAATPNRLSARDSLLVDAWRSTLTSPGTALQKWKSLTALYPDFYPANGPYSYYAWCDNHYLDAITAAKLNTAPQNPNASAGEYLLGILYLAQERYADVAPQFQRAFDAGVARTNYAALLDAAQRRFDLALQTLEKNKASGIPSDDLSTEVIRIALTVDQGRWRDAKAQLTDVASETEKQGVFNQQYIQGIELGLESEFGQYDFGKLNAYIRDIEKLKTDNGIDEDQVSFRKLFAIYLMAHNGDPKRASQLLSSFGPPAAASGETPLNNLRTIVDVELARANGHPQQAIESLKPFVNGNELFLTHVALMDAYASADLREPALAEARWLVQHRGRAYAEYGANQFMMAYNVVQSDLALLRVAELLHDLGKQAESAQASNEFTQAWPNVTTPAIAARKQALHHKQ